MVGAAGPGRPAPLLLADLPPGGRLGIYGFGAAQVALAVGAVVHVMTRSRQAQELALELGAIYSWGAADPPPEPLDSVRGAAVLLT